MCNPDNPCTSQHDCNGACCRTMHLTMSAPEFTTWIGKQPYHYANSPGQFLDVLESGNFPAPIVVMAQGEPLFPGSIRVDVVFDGACPNQVTNGAYAYDCGLKVTGSEPQSCREIQLGDESCDLARSHYGLPPIPPSPY